MKTKHLWKGIFNFYCEVKREYAYAYTKEQAKVIMARRLAKKQGVMPDTLFHFFKNHKKLQEQLRLIDKLCKNVGLTWKDVIK